MAVRGVDDFKSASSLTAGSRQIPVRGGFGKAALALTVSAAALALTGTASAQETQLPGIDVQGAQAKKSSAAKKKAKPAPAQAAEPAAPPPAATNGGDQAGLINAPYNTPAGVSVAGQSEIQTFGQASIDNVIRSMPGVSTRDSVNNPGVAVNIRGFEGFGRVNMSIDGVPQNFRFVGHEAGGFVYVDPLLLASIEVQRGAVSGVGGSGALAGSADMRTLDVDDILKPGSNYGALTSFNWGSNGVGFSEMGAGAIRSGAISVAGAISKHDVDDFKNGAGQTVPHTDQDLISGLAKVHVQIDPTQQLSFGTVLYNNEFGANSYNQTIDLKTYNVNYVYKPGNDLVDFRANFLGSDMRMHYSSGLSPDATSGTGRVIDDVGLGFNVYNTSLFNLGGIFVKSKYGYEYFHDDVDAFNKVNPSAEGGVNPSGTQSKGGAFSETTFSKSIFDLIVGLRYDTYTLNGHGNVGPGQGAAIGAPDGPFSLRESDGKFLPKVTLAAKPVDWFQPYVTYSESYRPPTISEVFAGGSHPGSGFGFLPNPFLQPEEQKGWEFGVNSTRDNLFQPGDALRLKADYYTMDVQNYVTAFFVPDFSEIWFGNNPGTSKVEGFELQGTYDAGFFFAGLSYSHSHTDLPSQVDGFGAHSYLPEDVATLTGGVRMLDQRLTVGARAYFTSDSFIGAINANPGEYLDGYNTVDLFSSYKFDGGLEVAFNVSNLTNVDYSEALSTPATGFSGDTGRGRTFFLTTRAQF